MECVEHVRLVRPIPYVDESLQPRVSPGPVTRSRSEVGLQMTHPTRVNRLNQSFDAGSLNNQIVEIPTDIGPGNGPERHTATIPDPNMPQLPEAPAKKKNSFTNLFRKDKKGRGGSDNSRQSIEERPPMPIPAARQPRDRTYALHYDTVRNTDTDQSKELIYHLTKSERPGEMCECGLSLANSELPMEWSMHVSREAPTEGRIFFMGPNDETVWELPFEVTLKLTQEQQDRIINLRHDFQVNQTSFSGSSGGSGSGNSNRSSAPVMGMTNGQIRANNGTVGRQQTRGQSMGHIDTGPISLNRQPQQHECHGGEDDVFHY